MRSWRRFRSCKGFNDTGRVCRKPSQINSKNLKDTAHLSSKQYVQKLINSKSCGNLESRTKYRNLTIMVTMPCWNEEGKVGPGVRAVPKSLVDTVCVVDNGSMMEPLKKPKIPEPWLSLTQKTLELVVAFERVWNMEKSMVMTFWPFLQGITKTTQKTFSEPLTNSLTRILIMYKALVG